MGQIHERTITNFSGGISEDKRVQDNTKFSLTKHFDAFTYPKKLVPFAKTQACDNETKSYNIKKFVYTNSLLYGLGDPTSGNATRVQIFSNTINNVDSWIVPANSTGTTANKNTDIFFVYKQYIFTYVNGAYISRFDTLGGAYSDTLYAITYTQTQTQAQPVLHPSDDVAYFFADNVVHKTSDGVTFSSALTLPSNQRVVSACPLGNYLALGCITTDTVNTKSIAYLWDRDSSLTTLSERVDFGFGALKHLASLDNKLIAIIDASSNVAIGLSGKVFIKQANGQTAIVLNTLTADATNGHPSPITATNFLKNNILYFPMGIKLNGDDRFGIWAVDGYGRATLAVVEEDCLANQSIQGIYLTDTVWWIAHSADGSVNRSSYLQGYSAYSTTNPSIYESLIQNGDNSSITKKLVGASVMYEPLLVAGATVALKYRKNEETAWTTIFSHSNDVGSVSHDAVNIESTGANLPQFNEIQFRIESTAGAVVTGLRYRYEEIDNNKY